MYCRMRGYIPTAKKILILYLYLLLLCLHYKEIRLFQILIFINELRLQIFNIKLLWTR